MITIINSDNTVTHQSKNLRGITAHSCHHGKPEVTITDQKDGSAQCYLRWPIRRISASPVPAWRMATSQPAHQR